MFDKNELSSYMYLVSSFNYETNTGKIDYDIIKYNNNDSMIKLSENV